MTATLPATLPVWLSQTVSMDFCLIPAGKFRMGSRGYNSDEEPIHLVEITRPFYLGKYPVTQEQFAVWTQAAGIDHKNRFAGNPQHPAEELNWHQAVAFCGWLTPLCVGVTGFPREYVAGLPTEAQWEYACVRRENDAHLKASSMEYHSGDGEAALAEVGWYGGNAKSTTHPVGEKPANKSGLHDMHGNVWEWCRDEYDERAYAKRVEVSKEYSLRVLRGGSWFDSSWICRAAYRDWGGPVGRDRYLGFRVCLFPGPVPAGTALETGDAAEMDLSKSLFPPRSGRN